MRLFLHHHHAHDGGKVGLDEEADNLYTSELKDGVLYVLLKEELRHDTIKTDLIISEIIRRLLRFS